MSFRRQIRRPARQSGGVLPVLMAVLALLIQALTPAVAAAQEAGGTQTVVLCTSMGEKIVTVPGESAPKPFDGYKCHDCVMAAVTAIAPPSDESLPVRYVAIVRNERARAHRLAEPARPPPRPPSQGPPILS